MIKKNTSLAEGNLVNKHFFKRRLWMLCRFDHVMCNRSQEMFRHPKVSIEMYLIHVDFIDQLLWTLYLFNIKCHNDMIETVVPPIMFIRLSFYFAHCMCMLYNSCCVPDFPTPGVIVKILYTE